MKVRIEIETGNAAFSEMSGHTPYSVGVEVGRILFELAKRCRETGLPGTDEVPLRDVNGNRVGQLTTDEWDHESEGED